MEIVDDPTAFALKVNVIDIDVAPAASRITVPSAGLYTPPEYETYSNTLELYDSVPCIAPNVPLE